MTDEQRREGQPDSEVQPETLETAKALGSALGRRLPQLVGLRGLLLATIVLAVVAAITAAVTATAGQVAGVGAALASFLAAVVRQATVGSGNSSSGVTSEFPLASRPTTQVEWLDEHIASRGDVDYERERRSLLHEIFTDLRDKKSWTEATLTDARSQVLDTVLAVEARRLLHVLGSSCSLVVVEETERLHVTRRVSGEIGVRLHRGTRCSSHTPLAEVLSHYAEFCDSAYLSIPSRRLSLALLSPVPIGTAAKALLEGAATTYQQHLQMFDLLSRLSKSMKNTHADADGPHD